MADVVFRLPSEDVDTLLEDISSQPTLDPTVFRPAGASGGGDLATVIMTLTPPVLTFLGTVITVWITRPRVSIEVDGIKISGVNEKVAERLVEALRRPPAQTQ